MILQNSNLVFLLPLEVLLEHCLRSVCEPRQVWTSRELLASGTKIMRLLLRHFRAGFSCLGDACHLKPVNFYQIHVAYALGQAAVGGRVNVHLCDR